MIVMAGERWGTIMVMLMLGMRMTVMVDDDGNLGVLMEMGICASLSDL